MVFLLLPFVEIYTLYLFAERFGFFYLLIFLFVKGFFALRLLSFYSSSLMRQDLQKTSQIGLHSPLKVLGSFLLMVPGFVTDITGLLLLLPGTRHILVYLFRKQIEKHLRSGRVQMFGFGTDFGAAGFKFKSQTFQQAPFDQGQRFERDVSPQVIDVRAEHLETEKIDTEES